METYKIQQENLAVPTFRSLHQSTHSGIIILHKKLINLLVSCQNSFVDHHDQKRANAIKQSSPYSIESWSSFSLRHNASYSNFSTKSLYWLLTYGSKMSSLHFYSKYRRPVWVVAMWSPGSFASLSAVWSPWHYRTIETADEWNLFFVFKSRDLYSKSYWQGTKQRWLLVHAVFTFCLPLFCSRSCSVVSLMNRRVS